MAITVSYPGVYIQELDSGVRVIPGVPTSITALRRPGPTRADRLRRSGCRASASSSAASATSGTRAPMGHSVSHFFAQRRLGRDDRARAPPERARRRRPRSADVPADGGTPMTLRAVESRHLGQPAAGDDHRIPTTRHAVPPDHPGGLARPNPDQVAARGAVPQPHAAPRATRGSSPTCWPPQSRARACRDAAGGASAVDRRRALPIAVRRTATTGSRSTPAQVSDLDWQADAQGIFALENADLFNLLCIPPFAPGVDPTSTTWDAAAAYCVTRRAMLLVDPPADVGRTATTIAQPGHRARRHS